MKTHPLIRPFKTLTEKVVEEISAALIQSRLICVLFKIHFKHAIKGREIKEFLQLRTATSICYSVCLVNLTQSLV